MPGDAGHLIAVTSLCFGFGERRKARQTGMSMTYEQHDGRVGEALQAAPASPVRHADPHVGGAHQGSTRHAEGLKMTRTPEERLRQFALASRHRYLVLVLRVMLPVLGLAVASLYLVGPQLMTDVELDVAGAKARIGEISVSPNALKMLNPSMQGFDPRQGAYRVEADQAVQDIATPHVIHLTAIRARVDHPDKKVSRLSARSGVFDSQKETLTLSGDVRGRMSGDLTLRLQTAFFDMKRKTIESHKPVEAEMINGTLRADSLFADTNQRMLFFKGRVKLRIKSLRRPKQVVASGAGAPNGPQDGEL